jgi:hypothetical protein
MRHRASDPELALIWHKLRINWFPHCEELANYKVAWSSRRQKRTLASCNVRLMRVTVARELNHEPVKVWLEPILYHEMCHAVLKSRLSPGGRRMWHDAEFRSLESKHPLIPAMNQWIQSGGWFRAVLSERSRSFWRKNQANPLKRRTKLSTRIFRLGSKHLLGTNRTRV